MAAVPSNERHGLSGTVVRFVLVGMLNAAVGYGVYVLGLFVGLVSEIALAVATVLGVMFNFVTTGGIVFRQLTRESLPRFILAYVVIYAINAALLRSLIWAGMSPSIAQFCLIVPIAALTFVTMRIFVFTQETK